MWGGEGIIGGVDRRVKKPVIHVALRDRIIQKVSQVFEGDSGVAHKEGGATELPRSGVWWGKPR
jgi:hypothetical protein